MSAFAPLAADGGRPLRIAWLSYRGNPHSGGQGVYTRYLAKELRSLGHHVEVLSGQPYPVLDDGIRLVEIPSMDLFRPDDPWHVPRLKEIAARYRLAKTQGSTLAGMATDALEFAHMCTSGFPEPWTYSLRVRRYLKRHSTDFDIIHDNQCFGYGIAGIQRDGLPVVATLHHPITVDRDLEFDEATRLGAGVKRRFALRRWYGFLGMQIKVARGIPRIVTVSESSRRDIVAQMGVRAEQLHVVPVGVDHERFRPLAHVTKARCRVMTTASADVPLKASPAVGSDRQGPYRTRRRAADHREEAGGLGAPRVARPPRAQRHRDVRVGGERRADRGVVQRGDRRRGAVTL